MSSEGSFSQWATSAINWLIGNENTLETQFAEQNAANEARFSAVETKQMATDQFVTDITNAVNGYTAAVTAYQTAVTNEVATLNTTISSLQTQLANAPADSAAIEALVTQLNTQTASVNAAVAAIPAAPVVPATPSTPAAEPATKS